MKKITYVLVILASQSMLGLLFIALGIFDWGVRAVALFSLIGIMSVGTMALLMVNAFKNAMMEAAKAAGFDPEKMD